MEFNPLIESYIVGEQLVGNAVMINENSKYPHYTIGIVNNSIIPTEHFIVYPDSLRFLIFTKYEPYASIVFADYHTISYLYSKTSNEFRIKEDGEKLYDILVNFEQSLKEIKEKYDEANRGG